MQCQRAPRTATPVAQNIFRRFSLSSGDRSVGYAGRCAVRDVQELRRASCHLDIPGALLKPGALFGCLRLRWSLQRGTLDYMPPEMFGSYDEEGEGPGKHAVTQAVDVYSFGLVLWQIVTGGCLDKMQGSLRPPR